MPPKEREVVYTSLTTNDEWDAALKGGQEGDPNGCLAVVECFASWCGPAEAMIPAMKRINAEMLGRKIKFYQANSKDIAELKKWSTSSRPVFLLISPGGAFRHPVRTRQRMHQMPLTPRLASHRCAGEQLEVIEGINAPALSKAVDAHIPEGLLDVGGDDETGAGDDDADE